MPRHAAFAVAGLVALFAAAHFAFRSDEPAPIPSPAAASTATSVPAPAPVEPARLTFALRHSLQSGRVKLWVGDDLVLDEPLQPAHGQIRQVHELSFPAGDYTLRAEVHVKHHNWLDRTEGSFESGSPYQLEAILSGLPGERNSGLVLFPLSGSTPTPTGVEETSRP